MNLLFITNIPKRRHPEKDCDKQKSNISRAAAALPTLVLSVTGELF